MDPIDQLLGKLDVPDKQVAPPSSPNAASTSAIPPRSPSPPPQSIDHLLDQLGEDTKQTVQAKLLQSLRSPNLPAHSLPNSLLQPNSGPQTSGSQTAGSPTAGSQTAGSQNQQPFLSLPPLSDVARPFPDQTPIFLKPDPSIEKVKAVYEEQQRAAEVKRQEELQAAERRQHQAEREKQQRLEQLRQQRRAKLSQEAIAWLKKLNPRSTEGQWFEEFACNYDSKVEAAVDYLEALAEAHRIGSGNHSEP